MLNSHKTFEQSESIIQLLAAQCGDLENLLALAQAETEAVEKEDFEAILRIVSERTRIGEKLEIFRRQIADLREELAETGDPAVRRASERVVQIANLTKVQDQKTRLLLEDAKHKSAEKLNNLMKTHRNTSAYLSETHKGLAYDRSF